MKKITFLLTFLLTSMLGFAQQVLIQDFETASSYTFTGFEGLGSASIVTDPVSGGTRLNGLQLVSSSTGNPWQGAEVVLSTNKIKLISDKTVQVDVYATQAFNMLAKVELGSGAPNSAASQDYTTPNTWQTLTFTFTQSLDGTGVANGEYSKIVFFPNWKATDDGFNPPANFTIHVDNITAEVATVTPDPEPTTAAPTPPARPVADVRSIFSNAYAPISVIGYTGDDNTYNNSWCGATTTLVQIVGDDTHKVTGLGCEGVTFLAGRFDATTFTHFHMDIWTASATLDKSFNVKFSNWNGGAGEANAIEFSVNNSNFLTNPNPGTWISLDIPLANFAAITNANRNDLVQFVITSDLGTVFYDNLYLHKNTVLSNSSFDTSSFSAYPNPTTNVWNITATQNITSISLYDILGKQIQVLEPNATETTINAADLSNGIYFAAINSENGSKTIKLVKN